MATIEHRPLSDLMGAEILNVDLSKPVSNAQRDEIHALFDAHLLLVFRNQTITIEDQTRAIELVGVPAVTEYNDGKLENYFDETILPGRLPFHQDYEFSPWPPFVNSLFALDIDEPCVPTIFASCARPVARMTSQERKKLESLQALHSLSKQSQNTGEVRAGASEAEIAAAALSLEHMRASIPHFETWYPIVRAHPRTGTPILCVTEGFTTHVDGLSPQQSDALLSDLMRRLYAEDNLFTLDWRKRDFVMWDSLASQHGRAPLVPGAKRTFRRMLAAERPFTATMGENWVRPPSKTPQEIVRTA